MENHERYYNINKLNMIFALVSVVLLSCLVGMFVDDYARQWKKYQKEFRALEIEKIRSRLKEEMATLKDKAEYQDLLAKVGEAKKTFATKSQELKTLEAKTSKFQASADIAQQNYQFAKARLDAARYSFESALSKNESTVKVRQKELDSATREAKNLRLTLETANDALSAHNASIQQFTSELKRLEKEKSTFSKQTDLLERNLKRLDVQEMSFPNKIANAVRDLPVLDFLNPSYRIEQVVLKDITDDVNFTRVPKVDRCMTCHVGVLKPGFEDAPQPFKTHPNLDLFLSSNSAHPVEDFGCTSCHGGRGRGTDFVSAAHMPSSEKQKEEWEKKYKWREFVFWESPILPRQYTQAGCFKCHSGQETIKGAEKLNLGLNVIEKSGCYGCHLIEKYKDWPKVGPDLTHLSSKTTKDWAHRWIKNPRAFRHHTWMPSFFGQSNNSDSQSVARADQEIHAMVYYLFDASKDFSNVALPASAGDVKKGEELVASLGCLACHDTNPKRPQGPVTRERLYREHGPSLTGLGTKTSKEWLFNWLKDPQRYHPETRMPNLRLSDDEANDLAEYLSQGSNPEFSDEKIAPVDEKILDEITLDFLVKMDTVANAGKQLSGMKLNDKLSFAGKKLIKHYGCFGCHTISGFETEKPIGTDLTEEGSKSAHKLDFGFVHIEHTNFAWFQEKLKNPRVFDKDRVRASDEKLKMPNFNFSEEEIEAVTCALLGFVKDKPADSKIKPRTAQNLFIEDGQKLVRQFNCQSCHIMEGEGGAIRPTVTEWLMKYQGKGENDAQAIAGNFSPPNLIGEGEKVQTTWLFNFIHSPETIRPWLTVRMPTFAMKAGEINTLIKYFSYLDNQEFPFTTKIETKLSADEYHAAEKLFSKNYFDCGKCHIVGAQMPSGSADSWAPDFALAKSRLKPDWIIKWLKNPSSLLPGTKMPTFFDPTYFDASGPDDILNGDENEQIRVLRDYLLTLTGASGGQPPQEKSQPAETATRAQ